ncbi:hypothetical protein BDF21DRAFT_428822 [Thamnidium elegans]|uniref:Uncharacterized protein n=1 Tax=Thamnidium elegans TaxID=101142 RepID=A0A8H7VTI2_9FUNG|nr:hypothetical protein INT48_000930 [Thamnidium elegans]KAI8061923.1 hypothetical protein BDF21DRAFT_428822 [Thamnidium elegans]
MTTINEQQEYMLPQFSIEEYEAEEDYFNEYDQEMTEAVTEADYHDCEQQEEPYVDDSLLKLIVDVQSYLSEAPTDSPLFALQYKMYTYLRQRASELGMDVSAI